NPSSRFASMGALFRALNRCVSSRPFRGRSRKQVTAAIPKRDKPRPKNLSARQMSAQIGYHNLTAGRQALLELKDVMEQKPTNFERKSATAALVTLIVKGGDLGREISMPIREFRKLILEVLLAATDRQLAYWFTNGELENLDLYEMDFSGAALAQV